MVKKFIENVKQNFSNDLKLEKLIARILFRHSLSISTAESCTGGLISSRLTDVSGSSSYIHSNFITYSDTSKQDILGVPTSVIQDYSALSEECSNAMVQGLFTKTGSDICLAITGVAGPTGATENCPVGTAFVAIKNFRNTVIKRIEVPSNLTRKQIKYRFSQMALEFLFEFLEENYK